MASLIAGASVGQLIGAGGALLGGIANRGAAEFNEKVATRNAAISRANTAEQVERERRMARRQLGQMRAATGASGITLSGSALEALADSAAEAELDALTIQHEGRLKEAGFKTEARLQRGKKRTSLITSAASASSKLLGK